MELPRAFSCYETGRLVCSDIWDAELGGRKPQVLDRSATICKAVYRPANSFNFHRENVPKFTSDVAPWDSWDSMPMQMAPVLNNFTFK